MLTVTTAAESYDLTTLATVRTELDLTNREDDPAIQKWISQASAAVSSHCRRTFAAEAVSETFRLHSRSSELFLSRYPVTAVASITECGTALTSDDYELDAEAGTLLRLCSDRPAMWPATKIVVAYVAGYAATDIPSEVERATVLLVKGYAAAGDRDPLIRSEQVDGVGNSTYFVDPLPPEVLGLLEPHCRPLIG